MSVNAKRLQPSRITFFTACRENTGASMLDSGGAYGRHHERPLLSPRSPAIRMEKCGQEILCSLETAHYLDSRYEIDRKLQRACAAFAREPANVDLSWFELGQAFMEHLGYVSEGSDNVYNAPNDLTQVFVYEVWRPLKGPAPADGPIYAGDTTRIVIHVHGGCDVRGGYGRPLICKARGDYAMPTDYSVGFYIARGFKDRKELTCEECQALDERWQVGYSSEPGYQCNKDIERYGFVDYEHARFWAELKTGEIVEIVATWNEE